MKGKDGDNILATLIKGGVGMSGCNFHSRGLTTVIKAICFCLASLFCNLTIHGAISLDNTFGQGGKVSIAFPDNTSNYTAVGLRIFVQPDGRIVLGGAYTNQGGDGQALGVAFVGLTGGGGLDTTFGNGGFVTDWTTAGPTTFADAYMYPDGRILRASQVMPVFQPFVSKIVRLSADGTTSNTFDSGVAGSSNSGPLQIGVRSNGKILALVFAQGAAAYTFHLIRFNADGGRDATFGSDGTLQMNFARLGSGTFSFLMEVLPDNRILLAGNVGTSSSSGFEEFFLMRLGPNGHIDKSFARQGVLRMPFAHGSKGRVNHLLIQPDGKILLTGGISNPDLDTWIRRFTANGKADGSFGSGGVIITDFAPGSPDSASAVALSGDGRIRIAGQAGTPSSFLVARYSSGGVLEDHVFTPFTPGQPSGARDITIQPDGKLLAIGFTKHTNPSINGNVWAVARYTE